MKTQTTYTLTASVFARTMQAALVAASTETHKPHLCTVIIQHTGTHLEMVATDGYRLNLVEIPNEGEPTAPALMYRTDAAALVKIAKDHAKATKDNGPGLELTIDTDAGTWTATAGQTTTAGQLCSSDYPPYRSIIPTEHAAETGAHFNAAYLADIGKTAAALATRTTVATIECLSMATRKPSLWRISTYDKITVTVLLMPVRV